MSGTEPCAPWNKPWSSPSSADEDRFPELEEDDFLVGADEAIVWDDEHVVDALNVVLGDDLAAPLEQACGEDGTLMPFQLREARLMRFGAGVAGDVERFIRALPDECRDTVVRLVCWAVRSERGRRTGNPMLRWVREPAT